MAVAASAAIADPFVPADDQQIVETLRTRPLETGDIEFRQLRAQLRRSPDNLPLAAAVAQRAMSIARRDGDPRYMGYAEAALRPWWLLPAPPTRVRLLRAIALQSTHQFDAALADLHTLLAEEPRNAQGWLTQASIFQVQGRYDVAIASCEQLRSLGAAAYADACHAELTGLTGRSREAQASLARLVSQTERPANGDFGWVAIVQAELAERSGDFASADAFFARALANNPDAYTKGAYADFLLDRGRYREVVELLQTEQRADALLLRLALAYAALHDPNEKAAVAALQSRFEAARLRGDSVHRREEARFTLHLLHQPDAALQLALANWSIQKEPADARVLLETARASARDTASTEARAFIVRSGWADQRLAAYLR